MTPVRHLLLVGAMLWLLLACAGPAGSAASLQTIDVFAAASLAEPFGEIADAFRRVEPGAEVRLSFGGSNQLRAQLEEGARADVFAPASEVEMAKAAAAGLIEGEAVTIARNRLVVAVPRANPGHIERLANLGRPGLKIAIAGPAVPVGAYTQELLANLSADPAFGADFRRRVLANVVTEEMDVRQVATKVRLGEVDAGVVYASDVMATVRPDVAVLDVPTRFNVTATYPIAVLKTARQPDLGRRLIAFVGSAAGQAVLERHGFSGVR